LGATRGQVLGAVLVEAALLGTAGSVAGVGLGALLARAVVRAFAPNVSRFFENIAVTPPRIALPTAALGVVAGALASIVASLAPALLFAGGASALPALLVGVTAAAGRLAARVGGVAARLGVEAVPLHLGRGALTGAALLLATALGLTLASYTASYEASCMEWVE